MTDPKAPGMARVWDPLVRIFHWSLVAALGLVWLTAETLQPVHEAAGYVVAGLIAVRLVWGLIGPRHARFARFVRGREATLAYLGDMARGREVRHLGHNPAGAAMIVALLVTLSLTAFTGWLTADPGRMAMLPEPPGLVAAARADAARADDDGRGVAGGAAKALHEAFANLTLILAALHVGGVGYASLRHRENLARAMVTGLKRAPGPGDVP